MPLVMGRAPTTASLGRSVATKKFAINTEPHVAEIGDDYQLLFRPEVMGDEFLDAWARLQQTLQDLGIDEGNLRGAPAEKLRLANRAVRVFLRTFMLEDSARLYAWWEVRDKAGKIVAGYGDPVEAEAAAAKLKGATVTDAGLVLPDRVQTQLLAWIQEVYGQRPPTSSPGSATPSSPPGTPSTGSSRSRASTSTRGRSRDS